MTTKMITDMTKKELLDEVRRLREEHKEWEFGINTKRVGVSVTEWENVSGRGVMRVYCKDLKDAVLVERGLRTVFPSSFDTRHGDQHIQRNIQIETKPVTKIDLKEFCKEDRW